MIARLGVLAVAGLVLAGCVGKTTDSPAPIDIKSPGQWSALAPMPTARQEVAVAELGGRIFVIGGQAPLRIFSATEMYEVAGNRWIDKDPMRTPRHRIGAVAVGGKIYLPGGATQPGFARTDVNEAYTP